MEKGLTLHLSLRKNSSFFFKWLSSFRPPTNPAMLSALSTNLHKKAIFWALRPRSPPEEISPRISSRPSVLSWRMPLLGG